MAPSSLYDRAALRVAVIDIGSNSTRLLIAGLPSAEGGALREIERRSQVTGLGRGVDTSGRLADEAIEDVCGAIGSYLQLAERHRAQRTVALATSAVRDAANGSAFAAELRERFALKARVISGEEEARLTWSGANFQRDLGGGRRAVLDIGGGSTELIIGDGAQPDFHTSLQIGVVRHTERFLSADPPDPGQLEALANSVRTELEGIRTRAGGSPYDLIAVAGTPATLAAMALELDTYDAALVEGQTLALVEIQQLLGKLIATPTAERASLPGLHPDRSATIVAGVVILVTAMRVFGLEQITVSDHDILWGAALAAGADSDTVAA